MDGGLDADGNRLNDRTMNLALGNVYNAFQYNNDPRSLIENATGGGGNDTIGGNDVANRAARQRRPRQHVRRTR